MWRLHGAAGRHHCGPGRTNAGRQAGGSCSQSGLCTESVLLCLGDHTDDSAAAGWHNVHPSQRGPASPAQLSATCPAGQTAMAPAFVTGVCCSESRAEPGATETQRLPCCTQRASPPAPTGGRMYPQWAYLWPEDPRAGNAVGVIRLYGPGVPAGLLPTWAPHRVTGMMRTLETSPTKTYRGSLAHKFLENSRLSAFSHKTIQISQGALSS